jgi:SAM-dependent methyltransferase
MRDEARYFVELAARCMDVAEPVVEIGAYQTPGQVGFADLRPLFAGKQYVGCDLIAGPGVDRVEDVRALSFAGASVGTVVCVDALEHVADPFRALAEIHRVLRDGGVLLLATPFAFPIHHRPDYTRFTPDGVRLLLAPFGASAVFSQGDAQSPHSVYSIARRGDPCEAKPVLDRVAGEIERRWHEVGIHDALDRCEPLASILRCDRPEQTLGGLGEGLAVEQSFACEADSLCRVEVKVRSHGEPSVSTLRLSVTDQTGAELAVSQSRFVHAGADRWVAFPFTPVERSGGRELTIRLQPAADGVRVAALASLREIIAGAELRVGGRRQRGTLCFEAYRRER